MDETICKMLTTWHGKFLSVHAQSMGQNNFYRVNLKSFLLYIASITITRMDGATSKKENEKQAHIPK